MKSVIHLALALLLSENLSAAAEKSKPILWMKHPSISNIEFQARIHTEKSDDASAQTYSELQLSRQLNPEMNQHLRNAFLQAQSSYLDFDMTKMVQDWKAVTQFANKTHWTDHYREMISIAYLRLAQIAKQPDECEENILRAVQFNPDYQPDNKMFPPPILETYSTMQKNMVRKRVSTKNWSLFEYAYIDGIKYSTQNQATIELAPGLKYITLISSSYAPTSTLIHTDEIENWMPKLETLFTGNCEQISDLKLTNSDLASYQLRILFHNQCVTTWSAQSRPLPKPPASESLPWPISHSPSIETKTSLQTQNSIWTDKRFWWGTAIAATAFIIYKNSEERKKEEPASAPSHREGF